MGVVKEFKSFTMKKQIVDMAVSLTVGAALGKIVTTIVADIIKPLITLAAGQVELSDLVVMLRGPAMGRPAVVLPYGRLLQAVFDFLIIAVSVFLVAKVIHYVRDREEQRLSAHQTGLAVSPK